MLDTLLPSRIRQRFRRYQIGRKNSDFISVFPPAPSDEVISLDMETSSLDTETAEILEIAAVPIRRGTIYPGQAFVIRVQPTGDLNPESVPIHQIRKKDLEDALSPENALKLLLTYIGSRPLVGYNIRFDQRILSRYCRSYFSFDLPNQVFDLANRYYKNRLQRQPEGVFDMRLEAICADLDIPLLDRHTAKGDALTVALAWAKLSGG